MGKVMSVLQEGLSKEKQSSRLMISNLIHILSLYPVLVFANNSLL